MSTEHKYLRTILLIQRTGSEPVRTGEIAEALDVAPASANEMIGKLADRGLVTYEKYAGATLTDEGRERARQSLKTYCIIQRFLHSVLEVGSFRSEAKQLESVIEDTISDRLDILINRRPECPDCFAIEEDSCAYLEEPAH